MGKIGDFICDYPQISGFFIIAIIITVILMGLQASDNARWNDGYCSCGGRWEYVQPIGHSSTTSYLYECDECGKMHEFIKKR